MLAACIGTSLDYAFNDSIIHELYLMGLKGVSDSAACSVKNMLATRLCTHQTHTAEWLVHGPAHVKAHQRKRRTS